MLKNKKTGKTMMPNQFEEMSGGKLPEAWRGYGRPRPGTYETGPGGPITTEPAPEQPVAEKPPADKFAEVGEAAYEPVEGDLAKDFKIGDWEKVSDVDGVPTWQNKQTGTKVNQSELMDAHLASVRAEGARTQEERKTQLWDSNKREWVEVDQAAHEKYAEMSPEERRAAGVIQKGRYGKKWFVKATPEELERIPPRPQSSYRGMDAAQLIRAGVIWNGVEFLKGTPEELEAASKKQMADEDAEWKRKGYDPNRMRGIYGEKPKILQKLRDIERKEPPNKWDNFDWKSKIDPNKEYLYAGREKVLGKSIIQMHDWGLDIGLLKDDLRLTTNLDGSVLYPPGEKFEAVPQAKAPTPPTLEVQQAWEDQGGKGLAPQGWQPAAWSEQPAQPIQPVQPTQPAPEQPVGEGPAVHGDPMPQPPADKFAEVGEAAYEPEAPIEQGWPTRDVGGIVYEQNPEGKWQPQKQFLTSEENRNRRDEYNESMRGKWSGKAEEQRGWEESLQQPRTQDEWDSTLADAQRSLEEHQAGRSSALGGGAGSWSAWVKEGNAIKDRLSKTRVAKSAALKKEQAGETEFDREKHSQDYKSSQEEAKRVETAEVQERGAVLRQENPWLSEILPGAPSVGWGKGIDYSRLGNASEEQLNAIVNMDDGDLRAVFSDPSYGEWGDSDQRRWITGPSAYAPHMIMQARNKARVELVKRQESPNKWENFDWQSKIDPNQDYIYPNGSQVMGKTLIDMSKMGLSLEAMVDDLRLVKTLDGKLLYPPDEGVTQQPLEQPVAEQPAPEQPAVEGEAPPKKFAEVGEAAYEPEKKPAGWMAPTEEKKEEEFAKAAATPTDAEFRTAVLSGQRWTAEDFPGKSPKDALDVVTKYNQWKKEYEAKYDEWKEEREAQPPAPPVEPPAPPVEPPAPPVEPPAPPVEPPAPPVEPPPEVPSPELPVQPEEPAPTDQITLPDGRVMSLKDALHQLVGWNTQQPGQPIVAPPGETSPGIIAPIPPKPPEEEDDEDDVDAQDPLPEDERPPLDVVRDLIGKRGVIEVDPGISREYITQRGENPQLEANRRIAELFQQAGPMSRSLLGQAGRGMAADVGTRSRYGLGPMAQAMLGARQAQIEIPWQRNLEQAQQERQRMGLAHQLGLQQAQMTAADYYQQARQKLQEQQRRWGLLQTLLNPLLSRRG